MVIEQRGAPRAGDDLKVRREGDIIRVSGDLRLSNAERLERELLAQVPSEVETLTLDLSDLDIEDGVSVVVALNTLRELRTRCRRLVVKGAPQVLGHNLYRVHDLEGPDAIELVDLREDEPYG